MVELQEIFKNDDEVMLLSHTVTREIDSVAQLKAYALSKGVVDSETEFSYGIQKTHL